jgi:subtilase family serine protease
VAKGWYELRVLSSDPGNSGFTDVMARSAPINVGPHPDVVVTGVTNPPAIVAIGGSFTVTDTTANRGTLASAGSVTRFYLSLDRLRNTGDRLLTGSRNVGPLAPNGFSTGTTTVIVPVGTPVGTYVLLACADDTSTNIESNETNNCAASASSVSIGAPDLAATYVSNPPLTAQVGATFKVSDTTENHGKMASTASVTRYYLSLDRLYGAGDRLLGTVRNVPMLAPNAASTGAVMVTVPIGTPAGTYFLLACADDTKLNIESIETNNCIASAAAMNVGP